MAKPVVDGLEQTLQGKLTVARVDVTTDDGEVVAQKYGVRAIPTYVLVDAQGTILYRKTGGRPDVEEVTRKIGAIKR
jgi:thioredoxin-like negative regulator of GroEL